MLFNIILKLSKLITTYNFIFYLDKFKIKVAVHLMLQMLRRIWLIN